MSKQIWQSKTFWGIVLMGYGFLANHFGLPLVGSDQASDVLVDFSVWVAEAVGTVLGFWGRLTATKKIANPFTG